MAKWPSWIICGLLLVNSGLLVAILAILLTGWAGVHHSNLPLTANYDSLSLEDLAMRFQYAEMYPESENHDLRGMSLVEFVRRGALHKGLPKREVMYLLGLPYNIHDRDDGSIDSDAAPNDWRYSVGPGTLTVDFAGGKLSDIVQGHDGEPSAQSHDDIILK